MCHVVEVFVTRLPSFGDLPKAPGRVWIPTPHARHTLGQELQRSGEKDRRERIEEHGRMLRRRLSEIHEKRAEREQEIRLLRGLEQFYESMQDALEDPSFETGQQVLRLVVDRIVVEDSRVVVHHVVPTGPVGLQTRHLPGHWAYRRGAMMAEV